MRHRSVKIPRLRVHYVSSLALLGLALAVAAPSARALPGRDEDAPRDQSEILTVTSTIIPVFGSSSTSIRD